MGVPPISSNSTNRSALPATDGASLFRIPLIDTALAKVSEQFNATAPARREATEPASLKFGSTDGFQGELRRRVDDYFERTGLRPRDCRQMYLKSAIVLTWFAGSYVLLVFFAQSWWQAIPLAVSFAFAAAAVTFNIQHDGGHQAYSDKPWINRLAALTMDMIGASSYLWRWKHAVFHHTCVNVVGHDADIDVGVLARLAPEQRLRWAHRWQHWYMWGLYALMVVRWHLIGDFQELAAGRIGEHKIPRPRGWDLVVLFAGKAVSISLVLLIPMFFHPVWMVVLYYMLVTSVMGVLLAVVFQLAHCVEEAEFPIPQEGTTRMKNAWAEHQVETTVDFATDSRSVSWLLGGLNFQVEHHLFPRVCHIHYPALSRIVVEVCREHGVRYNAHPTVLAGVLSHFRWLRRMGTIDPASAPANV